jgi:uncharacterized membrane protein YfbV (UPF0208 family)
MSLLRTIRFWSGTGTQDGPAIFAAQALLTTVFGFAGLWLLFRSGRRAETRCSRCHCYCFRCHI